MTYLFSISFVISLILCFYFRVLGEKIVFFCDQAGSDPLKIHKKPVPFLGGLAIITTTFFLFLTLWFFRKITAPAIIGIFIAALSVFLIGFWDDIKWKKQRVAPLKKLSFLLLFSALASTALLSGGSGFILFPWFLPTISLTFLFIFCAINAVNFKDGMDGLAASLLLISFLGFAFLSLIYANYLVLNISLILAGALAGFLFYNFPPASIFMGDSGAYFLGAILASCAMIFSKPFNLTVAVSTIFIIGIPVLDSLWAMVRRLAQRKSPFIGDRGHFYDRMMKKGFSARKTVLISCLAQLLLVGLGILITIYA